MEKEYEECDECGMMWNDVEHRTRKVEYCETCGVKLPKSITLCAEDHSHIECKKCFSHSCKALNTAPDFHPE
ncbi:MAG: hypothetical protein KU29_13965 [Sulfurovum sp. FS06-10]|nr:MAG: hypothetical protein KU29_13965 [Sulfurovum sp. FS06-10]